MKKNTSSTNSQLKGGRPTSFAVQATEYPKLRTVTPRTIRTFLADYDQYVQEINERHAQRTSTIEDQATIQPAAAVSMKFCVDAAWLKAATFMGIFKDPQGKLVSTVNDLDDMTLRLYLETQAKTNKSEMDISTLDRHIKRKLRMNMNNDSDESRMFNLFINHYILLEKMGCEWVITDAPRVAVKHIIFAVRPIGLRDIIKSDLRLAHSKLKDDYAGFRDHCLELARTCRFIENKKSSSDDSINLDSDSDDDEPPSEAPPRNPKKKKSPPCPHPECQKQPKGPKKNHYIKDCPNCKTPAERQALYDKLKEIKNAPGPAGNTRRHSNPSAGRLNEPYSSYASLKVCLSDTGASVSTVGRLDDGADDSLVCPTVAEAAALKGIGRLRSIKPVKLQVPLSKEATAMQFSFSRRWEIPELVMEMNSGKMALRNVSVLVADDHIVSEPLIIGNPVLRHLKVDTNSIIDSKLPELNGTDCSDVGNPITTGGYISRLVRHRKNQVKGDIYRPQVNYYDVQSQEDPFPDPAFLDPHGSKDEEERQKAIRKMADRAKKQLPPKHHSELDDIVQDFHDVFHLNLTNGKPAKLPPLKISLTNDAKPIRAKLRKYNPEQAVFLKSFVGKLEEKGHVYANPTSRWASCPLLVPKPGPSKFRFTVDLRAVNNYTEKFAYPMPILEHELTKLATATCYANFDLSHGYWQLPLSSESQECQSFITPHGVYSPTRVLHGTSNAVAHLQSSIQAATPKSIVDNLIAWLDDMLMHATSIPEMFRAVRAFLAMCREKNLKLHPDKCELFTLILTWCGRTISPEGIKYDPRRLQGLLTMDPPTTAAHLQQFLCALQWMRMAIPQFQQLVDPLHEILEKAYEVSGKRTSRAAAKVSLSSLGWSYDHLTMYENCKKALANQTMLEHRDPNRRLCLFTDACDRIWSGIVTQVPHEDLKLPFHEQRHGPLAFLSGKFNTTQRGWSIFEKEAFAILASCERMRWLLGDPAGFNLYTDHNNLVFIFDPLRYLPDLSASSVRKVLRWAVAMSWYNYTCFHISGVDNVWADLLGRWNTPPTVQRLINIPVLTSATADDFQWPSGKEIRATQEEFELGRPTELHRKNGLYRYKDGAIWIPNEAVDLQLRICIIGHTSTAGHRGTNGTESAIREVYHWTTLRDDVRDFVRSCIHCVSTTGGDKVPRPFGPAFHGTSANDLLQFDFLEIGPSTAGSKYILILRDDFSSFVWLFPYAEADSQNAASAVLEWCTSFATPKALMSDGGSHFKNETVRELCKSLRVPHHFTLPYTPWSNGAVERTGKELLRIFRATCSELQLPFEDWPVLVPLIQSALNNAPSPQRRNLAPVTIFAGLQPSRPVSATIKASTGDFITFTDAQLERSLNLDEIKKLVSELHPLVQSNLNYQRARSRRAASKGKSADFSEGDFVLVAKEDFNAGEKLALRWRGPRRILNVVSKWIYTVEDLRTGVTEDVHATRLRFYCDHSLDTNAIMSHVLYSERGMEISRLLKLSESPSGDLLVRVRWYGLLPDQDTDEPLQNIFEDAPRLVKLLLKRKATPSHLAAKAKAQLKLS